ncbi:hypothetical protein NLJ89_g11893 [Agrocybe chaxingu]|uniref:Uncharacterized protein n=1 Tax=Agrocybe chaxingu TaxID=84603 RepID=A0A9W8MMM6_9AGAR|nr:hypothetical protein NLJ89_g11893 [Agrocybe chaxingu]
MDGYTFSYVSQVVAPSISLPALQTLCIRGNLEPVKGCLLLIQLTALTHLAVQELSAADEDPFCLFLSILAGDSPNLLTLFPDGHVTPRIVDRMAPFSHLRSVEISKERQIVTVARLVEVLLGSAVSFTYLTIILDKGTNADPSPFSTNAMFPFPSLQYLSLSGPCDAFLPIVAAIHTLSSKI